MTEHQKDHRKEHRSFRYLCYFFAILALIVLSISAFSVAVDTDRVFASNLLPSLVRFRGPERLRSTTIKPIAIQIRKPDALILGASNAAFGIRASMFDTAEDSFYNAAIEGAAILSQKILYQHARNVTNVEKIVLTLDFFAFNDTHRANQLNSFYTASLLGSSSVDQDGVAKAAQWFSTGKSIIANTFSVAALSRSIAVARQNNTKPGARLLNEGSIELAGGQHRYKAYTKSARQYVNGSWFPAPERSFKMLTAGKSLQAYRELLVLLYADEVDTTLIINPTHGGMLLALDASGLWPCFENWKQELLRINQEIAFASKRDAYPLWDFASPNPLNNEALPAANDPHALMTYWHEFAHFKPALGMEMIANINSDTTARNFGRQLSSEQLATWFAEIRTNKAAYALRTPIVRQLIEALVEEAQRTVKPTAQCERFNPA